MPEASPPVITVTIDELVDGLADGTVTLVDVREPHEFAAGAIPGSISMPLSQFDPASLPVGGAARVVFSCAAGVRSVHAIMLCQDAGLDFREHFADGFKGWVMRGGPVERA